MNRMRRCITLGLIALLWTACGASDAPASSADTSTVSSDAAAAPDASIDADTGTPIGTEDATDGDAEPEPADALLDAAPTPDITAPDALLDAAPTPDITAPDALLDAVPTPDVTAPDSVNDAAAALSDGLGEDAAVEDTELAVAPEVIDAATEDALEGGEEVATEDVSAEDTSGPSCDPEGTWVLETTTAALPGEGCAPNGEPAQGANTKTLIVTKNPDGSLTGVLPEVTEPIPEITVTQSPDEACSFVFVVGVSVYFPPLGGEEPSTVYLTYTYTVSLADGGVHGSGTVYSATIFESGEVQQECTEAISVGGSFTPLGG
jgi:hypothetical protein